MFYKLYCEDCLERLKSIKRNTVDIVITSPPYNLNIGYDVYSDSKPLVSYTRFMSNVMYEIYRVTKAGGRICINVPPDIGNLKDNSKVPLDSIYCNILETVGFKYRTKIVWNKNTITARTAWGSFCSPSNPNILPPFEYILVFYKDTPKKDGDKDLIDITKEEFIPWTNGLWNIAPESAKKIGHPAPYPIELCDRLIKLFSYKNDVVLDPFMGSGTSGVSALKNGRNFIGIELSEEYVKLSQKRIEEFLDKPIDK